MTETVYTVTDFYDVPRTGVADCEGAPHVFEATFFDFDALSQDRPDIYLLTPISGSTLALALEDWDIWLRWSNAFLQGLTDVKTHPALPADKQRHQELQAQLKEQLSIDPHNHLLKHAVFEGSPGQGLCVRWSDLEGPFPLEHLKQWLSKQSA